MDNTKTILSIIAIFLTFVGYYSYVRDTLKGKTIPHVFTWFIWGFETAIAYGLQVTSGAGVGSWVTLVAGLVCFFVFFLGMRNGKKDITKSDVAFFVLSFIALFLWLIVKQPALSAILISLVAILGFVPTIRKSWNKPYSETLFLYELNFFRQVLAILALQQYNIQTWSYSATWIALNGLFSILLIIRRREIRR